MSFLNLRIRGRLYSGFGALLLFCAALAGFGIWQLMTIRDQDKVMELQSQSTIRAGNIEIELQAIRRAVLRFAFDQDEASFAESEKRLAKVSDLLLEAERASRSEERRAAYQDVGKDVAELKAKRADLGEAVRQMLAGRNLLFTDGDQMAADVQKFVDAAQGTPFQESASTLEAKGCRAISSRCWLPSKQVLPDMQQPSTRPAPISSKLTSCTTRASPRSS
jgi:hypothetical protein